MSKDKAIKPAEAKEVTATADDTYQGFVETAIALTRRYEQSTLTWYWEMGALYSAFIQSQKDNKVGGRTIHHFIQDIKADGSELEIGESTLYAAKQIHDRYPKEHIGTLVNAGVRVGHLKLLMPLEDAQRKAVEKKMVDAEGQVVSVRALEALIGDAKRADAQTSAARIEAAPVTKASDKPKEEAKSVTYQAPDDEKPKGDAKGNEPLKTPAKAEHRTATTKEFSKAPLPSLKSFGNLAVKTTTACSDAFIAAAEAVKVGFDSPRARENFITELLRVDGDAKTLRDTLDKLLAQFQETIADVKSTLDEEKPKPFKPKKKR